VTFQTAYLKANHPVEFMAALLSSEIATRTSCGVVADRKMGIQVLPPDVNESGLRFTPVKGAIRYGLAGIKGVGAGAVEALVKEREAHGPFQGLVDFCERVESGDVNRKTIEALVKCGAFDFTSLMRGRLFAGIETAMGYAASRRKDKAAGQSSLFDLLGGEGAAGVVMRDADLTPRGLAAEAALASKRN
jgi:DNA polymerase-3 subunit alpha